MYIFVPKVYIYIYVGMKMIYGYAVLTNFPTKSAGLMTIDVRYKIALFRCMYIILCPNHTRKYNG